VHLLAHGRDQQHPFEPVVAQLQQAVETYKHRPPDEDFALLHHREQTLRRRFQALFFAPLLGIECLSGFDPHDHPLETLVGWGDHRATLGQFLGQRARLGAAAVLIPVLSADQVGQMIDVEGHMRAYGSRLPMPKGTITMRGRSMAGSQAVMAHDDTGRAVFVAYYAPDLHLSQLILAYGQQVAEATGSAVLVIDRAVNSVALAEAFDEQGLGVLCMLEDNEPAGLESCEATSVETLEDGPRGYSGPWQEARKEDPRHVVIVQPAAGKPLGYWGTPKGKDALEAKAWPGVDRERNERQEHRFTDMMNHGALDINYGRKKILGADRHHQRKQVPLDQSLETAPKRVDKQAEALQAQQDKVAESASQGHGNRLEQRPRTLLTLEHAGQEAKAQQAKGSEHAST
jgi:hypothetical protein